MIASQTSDIFSPSSGPVPRRTSGLQVTPVTSETPLRRLECHQGVCLVGDIKAVDSGRGVPGVCPGLRLGSDPARLCPHCLQRRDPVHPAALGDRRPAAEHRADTRTNTPVLESDDPGHGVLAVVSAAVELHRDGPPAGRAGAIRGRHRCVPPLRPHDGRTRAATPTPAGGARGPAGAARLCSAPHLVDLSVPVFGHPLAVRAAGRIGLWPQPECAVPDRETGLPRGAGGGVGAVARRLEDDLRALVRRQPAVRSELVRGELGDRAQCVLHRQPVRFAPGRLDGLDQRHRGAGPGPAPAAGECCRLEKARGMGGPHRHDRDSFPAHLRSRLCVRRGRSRQSPQFSAGRDPGHHDRDGGNRLSAAAPAGPRADAAPRSWLRSDNWWAAPRTNSTTR